MLTFEDCLALSHLTRDEVETISRHAHVPDLCALELGAHLLHSQDGRIQIEAMLQEDIARAQLRRDPAEEARLRRALARLQQQCAELADERRADTKAGSGSAPR